MCVTIRFEFICEDCERVLKVVRERHECDRYIRLGVCSQMGFNEEVETAVVPQGFSDSCGCKE